MLKLLHFSSHLAVPPYKFRPMTNGSTQDQRQLSAATDVIRNNAKYREVMQWDLHVTSAM